MRNKTLGAEIISLEKLAARKEELGRMVVTSGGFDPVHPGHISCIQQSKKYGDTIIVIVNGDAFLRAKKGKPFQNLLTRCLIVSALRGVDYVVPYEIENDMTVCEPLKILKPAVFTKGGDRSDAASVPEYDVCLECNIKIIFNVGWNKEWSSSEFLKQWEKYKSPAS